MSDRDFVNEEIEDAFDDTQAEEIVENGKLLNYEPDKLAKLPSDEDIDLIAEFDTKEVFKRLFEKDINELKNEMTEITRAYINNDTEFGLDKNMKIEFDNDEISDLLESIFDAHEEELDVEEQS
jgi:hypothetical protein